MIELLRNAHSAGHSADYVLFDTWFSSPAQLIAVKNPGESFQIILTAMIDSVCVIFRPTETQLELFIEMFAGRLPEYIRNSLTKSAMAA